MTPFEIKNALEGAELLLDSREQDNARLRRRLKDIGWEYQRIKLDFGDYSARFPLPDGGWLDLRDSVAIERKMSIDEAAQCFTKGRGRFSREFERAREHGAKLYLLIENGSIDDILDGKYRTQVTSKALIASFMAWIARYDCQLVFCSSHSSGRIIREILHREGKERLESDEYRSERSEKSADNA